jgi:hypothetical protein
MDPTTAETHRSEDVTIALAAISTFQAYVQQADAKVSTLIVVHAGAAVATMASQTTLTTHPRPAALATFAMFALALLASGYHLVQALRPRMHPPHRLSHFGITGMMSDRPIGDASAEAWQMARLLAELADVKYRHIARAIPWTATMIVLGVAATLVATLTGR